MARTVRNPLETRTPVRTISSVMRNAPRSRFKPTQLDFGDRFDTGRPSAGMTSTVRPAGGAQSFGRQPTAPSDQAVAGGTNAIRPVAGTTSTGTRPASSITSTGAGNKAPAKTPVTSTVKPAAKPATKPAAVTKPAVKQTTATKPATKPTTVTKPVTKPVTPVKPTVKPPVKPITSTVKPTTPVVKPTTSVVKPTTTKPNNSLTNTLLKTAAGAGAGALINKIVNSPKTTTTTKPSTTKPTGIPTSILKPPVTSKPTATTTKPTTGVPSKAGTTAATAGTTLTDDQIQAELDRVKSEEQTAGIPEGATDNGDGTYTVIADGMTTTYGADGSIVSMESADTVVAGDGTDTTSGTTRSLTGGAGDTTVAGGDTTGMTDLGEGYFQDEGGNIYGADGNLMYAIDESGAYYDPAGELLYDPNAETTVGETETAEEATSWTDPDTGETWNLSDTGSWTLEGDGTDDSEYTNTLEEYVAPEDETVAEEEIVENESEDYEEAKGGSIKRKGGLRRFADGDAVYSDTEEEVQPWQNVDYNYGEFDDPTMTGSNSLYAGSGEIDNTYLRNSPVALSSVVGSSSMNGNAVDFSDNGDGTASYWDGNQYVTVDSNTGDELYRTDENGEIVSTGEQVQPWQNVGSSGTVGDANYYTDELGNTVYTDNNGNQTFYDPQGNEISTGSGSITSAGSGQNTSYAAAQAAAQNRQQQNQPDQTGILDALMGYVQNNPGLAGGAIGALISSLLSEAQSGESAVPSQPVDISELTSFAPRTTDFGAGMERGRTGTGSPIVSYADYAEGYGEEEPDDRLYSDLGISGWLREPEMAEYTDEEGGLTDRFGNPVDEYGYLLEGAEDVPEEETAVEDAVEVEEEPAMAAGGTTHYTFGRVMNPADNLGLGQGMKKGGLSQAHTVHSHHTNPVVDNRVDFRKGSAVNGAGDGQSDDIPAWLADGEYVMDAELVSMLGNGSNKAGAKVLDKFREEVRAHKRSAPLGKIPPKAKSPLNYIKEAMNG